MPLENSTSFKISLHREQRMLCTSQAVLRGPQLKGKVHPNTQTSSSSETTQVHIKTKL